MNLVDVNLADVNLADMNLAHPQDELGAHSTRVLSAGHPRPDSRAVCESTLAQAVSLLRGGQAVVLPTETVYGLAARAEDPSAVARIFAIKGRPLDNPLIVHLGDGSQLEQWAGPLTALAERLVEAFWPGPLTLVLPARKSCPWVTAGLDSIALRFPRHPFLQAAARESGPLAAPSANRSGRPSPTLAEHVLEDLAGRVPLIVDGGALVHGLESTVVDARGPSPLLLRPGVVTREQLEAVCGCAVRAPDPKEPVRSPGMKYRHYSPRAEVWLFRAGASPTALQDAASALLSQGKRLGVLAPTPVDGAVYRRLPECAEEAGRQLFASLRDLDRAEVEVLLVAAPPAIGVGAALLDRLERAASRVFDGNDAQANSIETQAALGPTQGEPLDVEVGAT